MGIISERLFKTNTEVWTMMNEKEFTALAEAYMDMVYRIALNVVGNRSDAEDTVQNVMLRLYKSAPVFESEQHAKHWLIRVTMNESKRIVALPWKKREAELDEAARSFAAEDSLQRSLLRQVAELAPKYRVVLYCTISRAIRSRKSAKFWDGVYRRFRHSLQGVVISSRRL